MILVTLSRYPDLFRQLSDGLDHHEPTVKRLLVRDGSLITNILPNWEVLCVYAKFNYARNVNLALEKTSPEDVLLIGDDVRVDGAFTETLRQTAYSNDKIGVACAQLHGQSPFVCGLFKRAVLDEVGPLDVRFEGYGLDDVDWCKRMEMKGYSTHPVEIPVTHTGGTSFYRAHAEQRINMPESNTENWKKFEDKWRG